MKRGKVRPIAICVIIEGENILVQEGFDHVKQEVFYRPLGGKVKFGEPGSVTVARELFEEINAEIDDIRCLGTLENIFTYNGDDGHEIVLIYSGRMKNLSLFTNQTILGHESDGEPIKAVWLPLSTFLENHQISHDILKPPLYPDGLIKIIQNFYE
jgi:ADP-ribose pyrophosphatase YjhB (NUDIX family)